MYAARINFVLLTRLAHARNAEINDLHKEVAIIFSDLVSEQHILQLEVSVDDAPRVAVIDRVNDLKHDLARFVLS